MKLVLKVSNILNKFLKFLKIKIIKNLTSTKKYCSTHTCYNCVISTEPKGNYQSYYCQHFAHRSMNRLFYF